jgi:uncharacterized membrane protein YeaQ/YmgE (transglycosylase-associated protein family)
MKILTITPIDILLLITVTSGLLAGLLAYLMVPSSKRESQECIKSMLFGIVFALISSFGIQTLFEKRIAGIPPEIHDLFLWCASFLPAFVLSIVYAVIARKHRMMDSLQDLF